jgi:hypothetical protein
MNLILDLEVHISTSMQALRIFSALFHVPQLDSWLRLKFGRLNTL